MSRIPTFSDITSYSKLVEDNEFFQQYSNEKISAHYEANYILLKYSPVLAEFKMIEKLHKDYQLSVNQPFLNFYWPPNAGLFPNVLSYFNQNNYKIGMQYLYWLPSKNKFKSKAINKKIRIKEVDKYSFNQFLDINFLEDSKFQKRLAKDNRKLYSYQFRLPNVKFLLAFKDNHPVGSVAIISSTHFLEIDNLLTTQSHRKQGVATALIYHVIKKADAKKQNIILVADAEDSPKTMYENMGFKYLDQQINARKKLKR